MWGKQLVLSERACRLLGLSPERPRVFNRQRLLDLFPYVDGVCP